MKDELTVEQSQRLIELGADPKKASYELPIGDGVYIFTLGDLLKMLPKELLIPNTKAYALHSNWFIGTQKWVVFYGEIECGEYLSAQSASELIDALYQLACWYYGEYLKSKQNQP